MRRCLALGLMLIAPALLMAGCQEKTAAPTPEATGAPAPLQSHETTARFEAAQGAARRRPNDPAAQINLARLAYDQGAYNDAYRAYRRAAELDSGNYDALVGLTKTNLKLQNSTEGLDWLMRARRLKPGDVELKELEGRLLLINGNFDRALACFQQALKADPRRVTTWLNLASAYALTNRLAEAVASARQAVKISPQDATPHFALGRYLQRAGDRSGAEAEYRTALKLDPNNTPAMVALARLLMDEGRRLDEARQLAVKASQLRTDHADAVVIAAWIEHLQGDDRKASNELIKLVEASPQNPEAWQKLSVLLNRQGKYPEAKQAAEMAGRFISGHRAADDMQTLDSSTEQ